MAWDDRIREAAYTSPGGTRIVFDYENVSMSVDKKTAAFDPPDANGTYVQDLGHTGRKYPLRVFLWGADYDQEAAALESALLEPGAGVLEHPIYGVIDVVPFGTIRRKDDLKTAANQAVFELVFWETTNVVFPSTQEDPGSSAVNAIQEYSDAAAAEFAEEVSLDSAVQRVTFKNEYNKALGSAENGLQAIADTQENVRKQFTAVLASINNGIDILVGDPLSLASQTAVLLQSPARALTAIGDRLEAYATLAAEITTSKAPADANAFRTADLYASTYVSGSLLSAVNNRFSTKNGALSAADELLTQFESVQSWRDGSLRDLGLIDPGAAYQQLLEAAAITAGFLVEISFTLKQERSIVLTHPRTIVDLAAELYGEIDEQLDFLIETNGFTGSEILEVPAGREVKYYV